MKLNDVGRQMVRALGHMNRGEVFAYFAEDGSSEESILDVIAWIRENCLSDLNAKVSMDFLIPESIKMAEECRRTQGLGTHHESQKMLRVSAKLLSKSFGIGPSSMSVVQPAVEWSLKVFDLLEFNEDDQGLPYGMLLKCGERLDKKTLRTVLDKVKTLVKDPEKSATAMDLLSAGFNRYNGAYMAFVAWENDPYLSCVTMTASIDTVLQVLGDAVQAVDLSDQFTLWRARAIFSWISGFSPVDEEKARKMVEATNPPLLKELI